MNVPQWILNSSDDNTVRAYDEGVGAGNTGTLSACNPYYGDATMQAAWSEGWRAGGGLSPSRYL